MSDCNFIMAEGPITVDKWSLRSLPLTIIFENFEKLGEKCVKKATGFLVQTHLEVLLFTNWHVFSGRDLKTHRILDSNIGRPKKIVFPMWVDRELDKSRTYDETVYVSHDLLDAEAKEIWLESGKYGSNVDVAALRLPLSRQRKVFDIEKYEETEEEVFVKNFTVANVGSFAAWDLFDGLPTFYGMRLPVGDDLFVLGFPLGLAPTKHFPVWKRASVATEMDILYNNLPAFLIDTATREGMSGSPVVSLKYSAKNGNISREVKFMGVYSGRNLGSNILEASLGVVWREEAIHDILATRKIFSPDFNKLNSA